MRSAADQALENKARRAEFGRERWDDEEAGSGLSFSDLYQRFVWLLSATWRSRWIMLAILICALALGIVATVLTTRLYTATASLQIDQQAERVLGTEDEQPGGGLQDADRFLQTNVEVLQSRATAIRVAQGLNLFSGSAFIENMGGKVTSATTVQSRRETVLELLRTNLAVNLPRNSRIVRITFRSPDPALSAKIANAFADNFIIGNLQRKYNSSSYARTFLEKQLAPARDRLETSERQLIGYARQAGLIDTQGEGGSAGKEAQPNSVTLSSLVALNSSYATATANRIVAEERLRVAQATPAGALPESYSNQAIQRLYETRAGQLAELQQEQKRHKPDYPTVVQAKAAIAELDRQVGAMNSDIRRSVSDQYQAAAQQERALGAEVERMKLAALAEKDRSVQYNTLKRDVDSNRSMYEALLQRYKEVSAAAGIATNNISIVDRADPPLNATSPRLGLNLAVALLLGLIIATAAAILRELFDDRVQNATDTERKFGMPALGVVPQFDTTGSINQELILARSVVSEAYHSAATAVLLSSARVAPKILMLTSAQSGEGKSSSAIGLASALGRLNKRAILIECDLRRPSLKDKIGDDILDPAALGLSEYLAGQAEAPAVHNHTKLRFDYILAGTIPPDPVELLSSLALRALFDDLGARYDHIILDAPPVLGLADTPILASHSDALLFVIEANRSHRGRAKAALTRIRRFDATLIGSILTKAPLGNRLGLGYDLEYYSYK